MAATTHFKSILEQQLNRVQRLQNEGDWTDYSTIEVPTFNKENFSFDETKGLTFFSEWEANSEINESSVNLSNVSYSVISVTELKGLSINTIPNTPKIFPNIKVFIFFIWISMMPPPKTRWSIIVNR